MKKLSWFDASVPSQHTITSIAISPDDKIVAVGSYGTIRLWCPQTANMLKEFSYVSVTAVYNIVFSLNGKMLAASFRNFEKKVWDIKTQQLMRSLDYSRSYGLDFSLNSTTIYCNWNSSSFKLDCSSHSICFIPLLQWKVPIYVILDILNLLMQWEYNTANECEFLQKEKVSRIQKIALALQENTSDE